MIAYNKFMQQIVDNRDGKVPTIDTVASEPRTSAGLPWYLFMAGLGMVVAVAISPLHQGITGDALWHIADGRWILHHHRLPRVNPFGWSTGKTPWINIEWGWDVATALLIGTLGKTGLMVWLGLTMAAIVWAQRKRWNTLGITTAGQGDWIALTILGVSAFWAWRPQLVSYAMVPVWLLTVESAESNIRRLWMLVPELLIWETFHGGYLLGLITFGLWLANRAWPGAKSMTRRDWIHVAGVAAALGLALGATPWGWGGVVHAIWEAHNPVIAASIVEWQSPSFHQLWWIGALGLPTVAVAVRTWIYPDTKKRISRFHWITWAAMLASTLLALRNYPFFVEQTAVVGAGIGLWNPQKNIKMPGWLAALLLIAFGAAASPFVRPWLTVNTGVPTAVVAQLKAHPGRIVNGYRIGDGLVYDGIPDSLDGRTDLFIEAHNWFQTSVNAEHGMDSWPKLRRWLDKEHVTYVLWSTSDVGTQEMLGRRGVRVLYHSRKVILLAVRPVPRQHTLIPCYDCVLDANVPH